MNPEIFRAYDIRGVYGEDFEPQDFYTIAQAYARVFQPKTVAVGHDVRATSPELWQQVAEGLCDAGVDVLNIGPISTDMLYFAVVNYRADGGLTVSASHNPRQYNGMKMVREEAIPISGDSGIMEVRDEALRLGKAGRQLASRRGVVRSIALIEDYLQHLRYFIDMGGLTGKRVVLNANCGFAGLVARRLLEGTPIEVAQELFFEPDGTFEKIPEGRPDPMRPENRSLTVEAVRQTGADFATAWDADADRCFFFDEKGEFIEGCYITARLAELLLRQYGGGGIVYDPRLIWAVEDCVQGAEGTPLMNKSGHSFMKERMRKEDGLFGGETSAHYYFRRNFYTDNGMVPFLLVLAHLCEAETSLSQWIGDLQQRFPVSGEINFRLADMSRVPEAEAAIERRLAEWGEYMEEPPIDGLSVRFLREGKPLWRFNLRKSNTEPVLRLNVEAIEDQAVLRAQTEALAGLIEGVGGRRDTRFLQE